MAPLSGTLIGAGGMGVAVGGGVAVGNGVAVGGVVAKMVGRMTTVASGVAGGCEQAVMTSAPDNNIVKISALRLNDCMVNDASVRDSPQDNKSP
jgi:hypothetical protein